jgi:S1-C subfamily serine protease
VGLAFSDSSGLFVVPGTALLAEAERLLGRPKSPAGALGVEVQALTLSVASATGSSAGVVVTWVAPAGAAKGQLRAGDVIESLDGRVLSTRQQWDVRMDRLSAGERLRLRVRRAGEVREVDLAAAAVTAPSPPGSLGLTLRGRAGIGAEVLRVARLSAADRAGLAVGDLITFVGNVQVPTPAQITRSFASLREGQHVLVGVTRADAHRVVTLAPWP